MNEKKVSNKHIKKKIGIKKGKSDRVPTMRQMEKSI